MKPTSMQETEGINGIRQPGIIRQSLRQCLYLLQKSINRYEYLKESKAPDMIINAEKALIRRQLLFLFNLRAELAK